MQTMELSTSPRYHSWEFPAAKSLGKVSLSSRIRAPATPGC